MSGFTVIELMMVVLVVAIVATLALPSFNAVVSRYRVRTAVEDVTATIYFARSEAIQRGGGVMVQKATEAGCTTPEASDWSCGWLVFADRNGNKTVDNGELLQSTPRPRGVTVKLTKKYVSSMGLNQWGESSAGMIGVAISPSGDDDVALSNVLCLSGGGSLRELKGASKCS
ncbi:GspH/FimT family pseudopilin [Variovorax rhizosphaerae]|uniref:Type II secretion system protein H n=1 Tax=Variovorax rhizosphaerae TaxID=1836200 RepID=A0ABU8WSN3_9BURK